MNATADTAHLEEATHPYCPNPSMTLWSSHPRVFLEFAANGEAKCPYCGTVYRLKEGAKVGHH